MAKPKSFKAELNPALQFISMPEIEPEQQGKSVQQRVQKNKQQTAQQAMQKLSAMPENGRQNSDNSNRSLNKIPEGYKANPKYIETKSKRVQLLMQPSLYERVKMQADESGLSVNECIHALLDEAIGKNT